MAFPATLPVNATNHVNGDFVDASFDNSQAADINALGVKVGTGASVPTTTGHVLTVTGAGASAWQAAASGFTNPMTTVGDIILGGTSGAAQRYGAGLATYVLTSNGAASLPTWQAPSSSGADAPMTSVTTATTTNYNILTTDHIVRCNLSVNASVTLPTAVGVTGKEYRIKKVDATAAIVTILTTSSQTIDGVASGSVTLSLQYDGLIVVSNGTNWDGW